MSVRMEAWAKMTVSERVVVQLRCRCLACVGCGSHACLLLQERPELVENMKLAGLPVSVKRDKDAEMMAALKHLSWYSMPCHA